MDKAIIARNFSRYAGLYDTHADIQKKAALRLLGLTKENNLAKILEIGCGTGNYTLLLKEKFKHARIKAVDISDKMIEIARGKLQGKNIEFIVADAENLCFKEEFDFITSNACFQWFSNLEDTLARYKSLLIKGGSISFSIFGPQTFWELNECLGCLFQNAAVPAAKFITVEEIKRILEKNFGKVEIEKVIFEQPFSSLRGLLNKIKYTGTRGYTEVNRSFTAQTLKKLEKYYLEKFRKIKATYQVFFCLAQKR